MGSDEDCPMGEWPELCREEIAAIRACLPSPTSVITWPLRKLWSGISDCCWS